MRIQRQTIIIGSPRCGKVFASSLAEENCQVVFEKEIKKLENSGIINAREVLQQAMRVFSFNDLQKALSDIIAVSGKIRNSFDELIDIQFRFKENQVLENEPSKYFSKPKNNFKRR